MAAQLRLIRDSFADEPALDTAVSRAVMLRVARGELPDSLRICRPGRSVAFGKRDAVTDGYADAVAAARAGGYEAIERLAGGRAAVFHEDTISFSHSIADPDPRMRIYERFDALAELMRDAFTRLGVDAHVGEVAGEYCPGEHSVNARRQRKLMGVGQRLVAGAAHVGGVVVVDGAERVNEILLPVYRALGLEWSPEATGAIANEVAGTGWDDVVDAILAVYGRDHEIVEVGLDARTLELARELAPEHLAALA